MQAPTCSRPQSPSFSATTKGFTHTLVLFLHLQTRIHQYPDSPATTGRKLRPPCRNVAYPSTTLPPLYVFLFDFQIFFKKSISCYSTLVSVLCFGCIDLDDRDALLTIWSYVYISFNHIFKPYSYPFKIVTLHISVQTITPLQNSLHAFHLHTSSNIC